MNNPHFTAAKRPIARRGSALPPSHSRLFVDRKADLFPMVLTTTAAVRSNCDTCIGTAEWRLHKIAVDPTNKFAVVFELI